MKLPRHMGPSDLTKWIDLGKPENVKGRPSAQHRRDGLTVPPERRATRKSATRSKNHLWFPPVVFPFYRTYHVLRQSSAACKALKVLKTTVLKRLASAVQLGPCPPCFQALGSPQNSNHVPNRSKKICERLPVFASTNAPAGSEKFAGAVSERGSLGRSRPPVWGASSAI